MFAEDQLERLRTFPDIGRDDLILFTLTPADVAFLDPGRAGRQARACRALATLPWLGSAAPARRWPGWRSGWGWIRRCWRGMGSARTPGRIMCGWRPGIWGGRAPADSAAMKDLEQFLLDRAMEHDSPGLLFTVAAEYRISAKTIRPGVVTPSATAPNP